MTKLIAQKSFFYGGRTLRKGEAFDATPAHAEMLLRTRQATAQEVEAAPTVTKPRRQYRRRDMRAEG